MTDHHRQHPPTPTELPTKVRRSMVEELTGRSVIGFMSGNHLEPDMGAELFVLEPQLAPDAT